MFDRTLTRYSEALRCSCRRQKERVNRQLRVALLDCVEHCAVESTHYFAWEYKENAQRQHTRAIYVSLVRIPHHDLSGIYHDELQDDKVPVSVHESPPARMSRTAPLLRRTICGLGTRPFAAALRTACLLGGYLEHHVMQRYQDFTPWFTTLLSLTCLERFGYLDKTGLLDSGVLRRSGEVAWLRDCPLLVVTREGTVRGTRGPDVVQTFHVPGRLIR